MNEHDLENELKGLKLARASDTYLDKGLSNIKAEQPSPGFWQRYLPVVLASALVVSVSANVFQLVNDKQASSTTDREQLTQCTTPAAAASSVPSHEFEIATFDNNLKPLGMC